MKYVFAYDFENHNWAFLTNVNHKSVLATILYYKARWCIETGFRIMDFADIKSKSTNIIIRTFLFLISIIFYNDWLEFRDNNPMTFQKYLKLNQLAQKNINELIKESILAKKIFNIKLAQNEKKLLSAKNHFNTKIHDNNKFINEKHKTPTQI